MSERLRMIASVAQSAKKALSLGQDKIFRLTMVMTILLGWLSSVGAGGLLGLENLYDNWRLQQESKISIYLLADSDETEIQSMVSELRGLQGIKNIERLKDSDVAELLQPYFEGENGFPLPLVLDVHVTSDLRRESLDERIFSHFPSAEVDDARSMLERISQGVRFAQAVTLMFSLVLFVVMGLLISLTVRAGLRGQQQSLSVLQYVGATDGFIGSLVVRQVFKQSFWSWVVAAVLASFTILGVMYVYPVSQNYISPIVWCGVWIVPMFLTLVTTTSAWWTSSRVIRSAI